MTSATAENLNFLKKVTVEEITEKKKGFLNPVLVSFQNGDLNDDQIGNMTASLSLDEDGGTHVEISSSNDQVFKEVNFAKPKARQFIAIHNKRTHKMRIVEVDTALLINSALIKSGSQISSQDVVDYSKNISALNKTFGGKKITSKLERREKLNLSSTLTENEVSMAVQDAKTEGNESLSNSLMESESITELLPPCNRDAMKLSDVYVLSNILNDEELEALKVEVSNLGLDGKTKLENKYSDFFNYCYNEIKKSKDNCENKLAALLYVETLIKFLKTPTKQLGGKKANFCTYSSLIHSKLIKEFCIKSGTTITRPFSMRDKILCYIMALGLICCEHEINLKKLAVVSSIHFTRLSRLARAVGMVPSSKDETMFALKLPLPPLPKSSVAKTKRK